MTSAIPSPGGVVVPDRAVKSLAVNLFEEMMHAAHLHRRAVAAVELSEKSLVGKYVTAQDVDYIVPFGHHIHYHQPLLLRKGVGLLKGVQTLFIYCHRLV